MLLYFISIVQSSIQYTLNTVRTTVYMKYKERLTLDDRQMVYTDENLTFQKL